MADSWFPFQEVPGLLSPEMSSNVRTSSILGAAAGLLGASGYSEKPRSIFEALGAGLQGGLQGYDTGQQHAIKQLLMREQVEKLAEARRQAAQWASIFGVPGQTQSAAMGNLPGPAMPAMPQAPAAPMPPGLVTPPVNAPRAPIPSSAKVWGDTEAEQAGLYEPQGLLTPAVATAPQPRPPQAPAAPPAALPVPPMNSVPTQREVRATANAGLRQVIAEMPQGVREMIAIAGPEKGKEILGQWVGKKAEKPSDNFLTVEMQDGTTKPYRADDPALDAAIKSGGLIVTTPSSKAQNDLVTLRLADGSIRAFRKADPVVDQLVSGGAVEVTKPSSDPKDHKPDNYALPDGRTVLSTDGRTYIDPATKQPMPMPTDAVRLGAESGYQASRENAVRGRAQSALDAGTGTAERPAAETATKKGTGTWSNLASAYNAVAGGLGLDKAFGKNGVFAENEANRNYLLNIRQSAKTALVNNPRFPVAEQKTVDRMFPDPEKFWANPRTEADKIPLLRNTLEEQLRTNNEALAAGALPKEEIARLTTNNLETKRALRLLGHGDSSLGVLEASKPAAAAAPAAPAKTETPPVDGARKAPDGQWYLPDPKRPGKYLRVSGTFNERFASAGE